MLSDHVHKARGLAQYLIAGESPALTVVFALAALYVLLLANESVREFRYARSARAHGCTPPHMTLDRPYFGVRSMIRIARAARHHQLLKVIAGRFEQHGQTTVRQQMMFNVNIVTIEPENIKSILATNFKDYSIGLRKPQLAPLLGNGIFAADEAVWRHSRSLLRPHFTRDKLSHLEMTSRHTDAFLAVIKQHGTSGEYVDVQDLFHKLTIDSASEFLFGQSVETLAPTDKILVTKRMSIKSSAFANAIEETLVNVAARARVGPLYWLLDSFAFRRRIHVCHSFVDAIVADVLDKYPAEKPIEAPSNFLEALTSESRNPVFLRDQAFSVLLAGRDTTSSLLSFTLYYLVRHPEVWNKLRETVLDTFGETTEHINFETLKRCTYLTYVLNEVLRLSPAVPLNFRTATVDSVLPCGAGPDGSEPVFVPKGTQVIFPIFLVHRQKKYFGEDADKFRPERWGEQGTNYHTWDYLPFNAGPRICLGQQFALQEAGFILVRMLQTYEKVSTRAEDLDKELRQRTHLTMNVAGGVWATFE